jgi:hypothetical protein
MAKVVYRSLKPSKPVKRSASVTTKRVRSSDGKAVTVYTIDADSHTFGDDLSYVFRQNVKKARRQNKQLLGSAAGVAEKG